MPGIKQSQVATVVLLILLLISSASAESGDLQSTPHRWLRSFGIVTGFGHAPLSGSAADYEVIPLLYQISIDINPLAKRLRIKSRRSLFEFLIEPLTNVVVRPDTNAEIGCSFHLRYSAKFSSWIAPYLELGVGFLYSTQHISEQGSQFNFTPQLGVGMQFSLNDHYLLSAGYRYRHMSNAGTAKPNRGIDFNMALVGLSYVF